MSSNAGKPYVKAPAVGVFGNKLRDARMAANLTGKQLGEIIGVTQSGTSRL